MNLTDNRALFYSGAAYLLFICLATQCVGVNLYSFYPGFYLGLGYVTLSGLVLPKSTSSSAWGCFSIAFQNHIYTPPLLKVDAITPDVPPENIIAMFDAVDEFNG